MCYIKQETVKVKPQECHLIVMNTIAFEEYTTFNQAVYTRVNSKKGFLHSTQDERSYCEQLKI